MFTGWLSSEPFCIPVLISTREDPLKYSLEMLRKFAFVKIMLL